LNFELVPTYMFSYMFLRT